MPAQNLHATLLFLGSVVESRLPELATIAARTAGSPFRLVFDRVEFWEQPGVLVATTSAAAVLLGAASGRGLAAAAGLACSREVAGATGVAASTGLAAATDPTAATDHAAATGVAGATDLAAATGVVASTGLSVATDLAASTGLAAATDRTATADRTATTGVAAATDLAASTGLAAATDLAAATGVAASTGLAAATDLAESLLREARLAGFLDISRSGRFDIFQKFRPHVTLARKVHHPPRFMKIAPVTWSCADFVLAQSETLAEGPVYTVLERFPLGR